MREAVTCRWDDTQTRWRRAGRTSPWYSPSCRAESCQFRARLWTACTPPCHSWHWNEVGYSVGCFHHAPPGAFSPMADTPRLLLCRSSQLRTSPSEVLLATGHCRLSPVASGSPLRPRPCWPAGTWGKGGKWSLMVASWSVSNNNMFCTITMMKIIQFLNIALFM